MKRLAGSLELIGMGACIGYVVICWGADLLRVGNLHPGARAEYLFRGGFPFVLVGFICAVLAFQRKRVLALVTLIACVSWVVWALLPRL